MSGKKGGNKGGKGGQGAPEGGEKEFKFNFGEGGAESGKFNFSGKESALLPMIQQRLGTLVGSSSGYLESLPLSVQKRVRALKKLQSRKSELDKEYKKELIALQDKFEKLFQPLYDRRRDLVQGQSEPTEEEAKEEEKKEEKKEEGAKEEKKEVQAGEDIKGIPDFWLEAFKHHDDFGELITKKDEAALKHLIDVRIKAIPDEKEKKYSPASFILEFEFSENPFFTNKVLTKTYYLTEDEIMGETMFDHMDASPIEWKAGKNLTVKLVKVEQPVGGKRGGRGGRRGGKGGKGPTKTITVEEPCESFFNFFNSNIALGMEEEDLGDEEMQELFESDYELGIMVKEQIIPSAVLWFTGEIQQPAMFFGDEDGEDGEYDSAEDADFEADPNQPAPAQGGEQKPECNQQ